MRNLVLKITIFFYNFHVGLHPRSITSLTAHCRSEPRSSFDVQKESTIPLIFLHTWRPNPIRPNISRIFNDLQLTFIEMIGTSHFMLVYWFDGLGLRGLDSSCGLDIILTRSNANICLKKKKSVSNSVSCSSVALMLAVTAAVCGPLSSDLYM